jgi:hypothetical protein
VEPVRTRVGRMDPSTALFVVEGGPGIDADESKRTVEGDTAAGGEGTGSGRRRVERVAEAHGRSG